MRSAVGSSALTSRWATLVVPDRPEPSRSLKSTSPLKPSERQKRITVGVLTPQRSAMRAIESLIQARGADSRSCATMRSDAESLSIEARMSTSSGPAPWSAVRWSSSMAEAPRRPARGAATIQVGTRASQGWKRPLASKRARKADCAKKPAICGTMPPPM